MCLLEMDVLEMDGGAIKSLMSGTCIIDLCLINEKAENQSVRWLHQYHIASQVFIWNLQSGHLL